MRVTRDGCNVPFTSAFAEGYFGPFSRRVAMLRTCAASSSGFPSGFIIARA